MKYHITRTDVADSQIRSIILYVAEKFGTDVALQKLNALEQGILTLADNPNIGIKPRYLVLKRQGCQILILEKNLVFYKVNEGQKEAKLPGKAKSKVECKEVANPKLNFVISSYYKGTGLEEVLKKQEQYLDHAEPNESDITNL